MSEEARPSLLQARHRIARMWPHRHNGFYRRVLRRDIREARESVAMDVEWLHATLEWLILGEPDPDISRPTMARKAHDKIDRLGRAALHA